MTIEFYYFWEIIKNYAKFSNLFSHWSAIASVVISFWIRAIICIIDSSPCLNRSDNRLDMINPVILLALCCKSLTFAFSGCFTMLVGISTVFLLRNARIAVFCRFWCCFGFGCDVNRIDWASFSSKIEYLWCLNRFVRGFLWVLVQSHRPLNPYSLCIHYLKTKHWTDLRKCQFNVELLPFPRFCFCLRNS